MVSGAPGVQMQVVPDDLISIENTRKENGPNIRAADFHRCVGSLKFIISVYITADLKTSCPSYTKTRG
jgi:hypothetical protein